MTAKKSQPLAQRMRPTTFDDFFGQEHIVGKNSLLRRAILTDSLGSCIFYGPTGCGKTTLANIIANTCNCNFVQMNAVSSGIADAKKVIDDAKRNLEMYGSKTYLMLDECHRWSKSQSDCMLAAIEQGHIIFVGSTTENPYFAMTKAIVSRCRIFEFHKLSDAEMEKILQRAIVDKEKGLGNYDLQVAPEAIKHFIWSADGDVRNALNSLELATLSTQPNSDGKIVVDLQTAAQSSQQKVLSVDENMYYDMLSAFCKSLRGSDSDSACYWAERLIQAGCDPLLIARRVIAHSAEDVGMADPQAVIIATTAMTAFQNMGLPEGKLPLFEAIIYVCEAPKSNAVYLAMAKAQELVAQRKDDTVPYYLRSSTIKGDQEKLYKYPHLYPNGWVDQQYLPDTLKDEILYQPTKFGKENGKSRKETMKELSNKKD
ncbi:MAG: replication-associated recombination protein A [Clostridia bacterium]